MEANTENCEHGKPIEFMEGDTAKPKNRPGRPKGSTKYAHLAPVMASYAESFGQRSNRSLVNKALAILGSRYLAEAGISSKLPVVVLTELGRFKRKEAAVAIGGYLVRTNLPTPKAVAFARAQRLGKREPEELALIKKLRAVCHAYQLRYGLSDTEIKTEFETASRIMLNSAVC